MNKYIRNIQRKVLLFKKNQTNPKQTNKKKPNKPTPPPNQTHTKTPQELCFSLQWWTKISFKVYFSQNPLASPVNLLL